MSSNMKYALLAITFAIFTPSLAHGNALEWANGNWGIDVDNVPEGLNAAELNELRGCDKSPVVISTDEDTMRYVAVHTGEDNFTARSPILTANDAWISLRYDGETRLMKNGELQMWHMFFVSPDKFYWIIGPGVTEDERDRVLSVARVRCLTIS